MYNQTEVILSQYELEIRQVSKGRGFYICDTGQGQLLLSPFKGSGEKGEWIRQYLEDLQRAGYPAEQIFRNKNNAVVTEDEVTGERFWVKTEIRGRELNTGNFEEMTEAAGMLARFHNASAMVQLPEAGIGILQAAKTGTRHTRELIKVKNYIWSKKKKQEFERIYLQNFQSIYRSAEESCRLLEQAEEETSTLLVCHGDCNQHNIVRVENHWQLIHFENVIYGWVVWDLAGYMRKMMEKNNWDMNLGRDIVKSYHAMHPLTEQDLRKLYALLLFPEKFWKLANHYMSSNKAWIPEKDIEKLKKVIEQEKCRLNFVENLFSICP